MTKMLMCTSDVRFTTWIDTSKKYELQKKTRQLYRWMIGSVFRRIHSRKPGMTSEGLKVSIFMPCWCLAMNTLKV